MWTGGGECQADDEHDRRGGFEGAPRGLEPAAEVRRVGERSSGPVPRRTGRGHLIGRAKGRMNTKLRAVTDAQGRPLRFFMTAGQISDYTGACCRGGHRVSLSVAPSSVIRTFRRPSTGASERVPLRVVLGSSYRRLRRGVESVGREGQMVQAQITRSGLLS